MNIDEFLSSHPYAETTKRTYRHVLYLLEEQTETAGLKAADLIKFIQNQSGWGNARQCVALAACIKYIAWKHGHSHPATLAKLKRTTGKPQRALTPDLAKELLASFDRHRPAGARDLAIASLALDTGLRLSELCRLQQADVDTEKGTLQVIIKGGQWAAAVFGVETAAHIEHWKRFRETLNPKGFLFVSVFDGNGLKTTGLQSIIRKWGRRIGIKLSPHDLRRSFAVLTTLNGAPERVLMEAGRWKSSQMITRYTRTLKLSAVRQYLVTDRLK